MSKYKPGKELREEHGIRNFEFFNNTSYTPLISLILGLSGFFIAKKINKKEKEFLD